MPSGGRRPGAGRPYLGRKQRTIYVTDNEMVAIRELLEQLRKQQEMEADHEESKKDGGEGPEQVVADTGRRKRGHARVVRQDDP